MDPSITESPTLKTQKDLDVGTLEKLWKLFSSSIFSYIMEEFEQRVKKVPQLSKYFKDLDISKTFHGKLDFFKRNIGKTDMTQHNRFYLETIHKKMNIEMYWVHYCCCFSCYSAASCLIMHLVCYYYYYYYLLHNRF